MTPNNNQSILTKLFFTYFFFINFALASNTLHINDLPDEVLLNIFQYLEPTDLCRQSTVSQGFRILLNDDHLWHRKTIENFGQEICGENENQNNWKKYYQDLSNVFINDISNMENWNFTKINKAYINKQIIEKILVSIMQENILKFFSHKINNPDTLYAAISTIHQIRIVLIPSIAKNIAANACLSLRINSAYNTIINISRTPPIQPEKKAIQQLENDLIPSIKNIINKLPSPYMVNHTAIAKFAICLSNLLVLNSFREAKVINDFMTGFFYEELAENAKLGLSYFDQEEVMEIWAKKSWDLPENSHNPDFKSFKNLARKLSRFLRP